MPTITGQLVLSAATVERLEIGDVTIEGHPDPTELTVEWQLSAAASTVSQAAALDAGDFQPAAWFDTRTIRTGLVDTDAGTYGCWVRVTAGDEHIVRYAGRVVLI